MSARGTRSFIAVGALMGAAGVALMASGAHGSPIATTAGQMLLMHSPAVIAATLTRDYGHLNERIGLAAIVMMIAGVSLFAGDLAVRLIGWPRLFPMAAPIGGSLTILSWVVLAAAALVRSPRG